MAATGEQLTPYFLVYLGLAWLGGIALGRYVSQPIWAWLALAALSVFGLVVTRDDRRVRIPLICALALSLGAARYQSAQPTPGDPAFIATYNDRGDVTLEGVVVGEPDIRERHVNLRLRVDTLLTHGDDDTLRRVRGLILVQAPRFPVYSYGDRLRVFGALETPTEGEDFSYREFLARQGVYSLLRFGRTTLIAPRQCQPRAAWDWNCNPFFQAIFDFKAKALAVVAAIFPEPQASLLSGILLGVEYGIPQSLKDAFSATGTSHIVAISGQI
ncbi:MAG: DUF4131 domain-containing protein [Chloroflexi bacterium]|nr:DUF4131 domain-containing protein [Chloroflexota bacterium]